MPGLQQACNDMRFPCASCEIGIAIMRKIMSKIMRITANAASDNAFVQHAAIIVYALTFWPWELP